VNGNGKTEEPITTDIPYKYSLTYKTGRDALTYGEVVKLLNATETLEDATLLELAISTGMRRDDIVNVQVGNIKELPSDTGFCLAITYWEKKRRRFRQVYVWGVAAKHVVQLINHNRRLKTPWLFPSPRDPQKHISSRHAYDVFQRNLQKAGLRGRPFHALRATCMKMAQRAGWTIEQTMELTGDSFRTIQEHYLTPSEDELIEVAKVRPILPQSAILGENELGIPGKRASDIHGETRETQRET